MYRLIATIALALALFACGAVAPDDTLSPASAGGSETDGAPYVSAAGRRALNERASVVPPCPLERFLLGECPASEPAPRFSDPAEEPWCDETDTSLVPWRAGDNAYNARVAFCTAEADGGMFPLCHVPRCVAEHRPRPESCTDQALTDCVNNFARCDWCFFY